MTSADRLKQVLEIAKLNQQQFADSIGTTQATLSRQLKGIHKIDKQAALAIQAVHNINAAWVLTGKGEMFLPGKEPKKGAPPESAKSIKDMESRYGHVESRECEKRKNHRGFEVIDGNVQEYPEIDIIEKIARTKWWYGLTETEREIIVFAVHLHNDEMKEKVRNILGNSLTKQDAEEKLNREMKELAEEMKRKMPSRQKGEAG